MIRLESKNNLIFNTISNYLENKNYFLTSEKKKYQTLIEVNEIEKHLILIVNGSKTKLSLPVDLNILASEISKSVMDINYTIGKNKYFPYQRLITDLDKKSYLSDIQNIIISKLLIYDEGIDKDLLYKSIWKRDKQISINKLDTHLTNLKSQLKSDLQLKINFQSQNKILRLLIN